MSRNDPIDFDSPLGISKREWTKVLGVNLALLLVAYSIALVLTLCGSDVFLLKFQNEQLENIEKVIRYGKVNFYPLIQAATATIESMIIISYITKRIPRFWVPLSYFAYIVSLNVIANLTNPYLLQFVPMVTNLTFFSFIIIFHWIKNGKGKKRLLFFLARFCIAAVVSFCLNELIGLFRTLNFGIGKIDYSNSAFFALTLEYDLALGLALGFLTLLIHWEKGERKWEKCQDAGGSSPTSKRWSWKNSQAKNNLTPKQRKRIFLLKARVIVIQTVALAVIAALPWFAGRPIEFSLLYVAFCMTRVILGFSHSLHFKSELACITIGALGFWGLTFLAPSAEASIIMSLAYGAGLALGFRLYWEMHDLMMYRKTAKTDRYAMFYAAFKGNTDPRHIRGLLRLKTACTDEEIKAVQMYMAKEKVDYIAEWLNEPLRTVDRRLTEIADEIYSKR